MLLVINGRVCTVRCGWEMSSPNTGFHRIQAPFEAQTAVGSCLEARSSKCSTWLAQAGG